MTRYGDRADAIPTQPRASLEANWRRKMIDPIGQVWTPFASARGDVYSYSNAVDPVTHAGTLPDDTVLRGHGRGRRALLLSVRGAHGVGSHVHRADGADHRAPEPSRSAPPARRGRQEPDLRRHAAVRHRQVLGLRPLRDRHRAPTSACSTRSRPTTAVYARAVFGQSFHLAGENPYRRSGPRPDRRASTTRPSADSQTNRSDYVAGVYLSPFAGLQPHHAKRASTRRTGRCAARIRPLQGTYGPAHRRAWPTPSAHFDPVTGLIDNAAGDHDVASA